MYDQQSLRSACPYEQSDQSLTECHLEFLSLKGGCRGSSKSTHVKMPHCWKSHAMAHIREVSSDTVWPTLISEWQVYIGRSSCAMSPGGFCRTTTFRTSVWHHYHHCISSGESRRDSLNPSSPIFKIYIL